MKRKIIPADKEHPPCGIPPWGHFPFVGEKPPIFTWHPPCELGKGGWVAWEKPLNKSGRITLYDKPLI